MELMIGRERQPASPKVAPMTTPSMAPATKLLTGERPLNKKSKSKKLKTEKRKGHCCFSDEESLIKKNSKG